MNATMFTGKSTPVEETAPMDGHFRNVWSSPSFVLILANALGFLAMLGYSTYLHGPSDTYVLGGSGFRSADLRAWGSNYGPATLGGQYWRIVSSLFVHSELWHLGVNMLFLWLLARSLQRLIGPLGTIGIYLLTGAAGSLLSIALHPVRNTFGASGAVSGLAGALIAYIVIGRPSLSLRETRLALLWATLCIALSITSGLLSTGIDNTGHVGGLVCGLVAGTLMAWRTRLLENKNFLRPAWLLAAGLMICLIALVTLTNVRLDVVELYRGERALRGGDPANAVVHIKAFVERNPSNAVGHQELGNAYERLNDYSQAEKEYRRWFSIQPGNPEAQYELGRVWLYHGHVKEAATLLAFGVPRLPQDADRYYDLVLALTRAGDLENAEGFSKTLLLLDPKSSRNHYLLSTILTAEGKTYEAAAEQRLADQLRSEDR
jgi:membrane associated rhomboid family serine protease